MEDTSDNNLAKVAASSTQQSAILQISEESKNSNVAAVAVRYGGKMVSKSTTLSPNLNKRPTRKVEPVTHLSFWITPTNNNLHLRSIQRQTWERLTLRKPTRMAEEAPQACVLARAAPRETIMVQVRKQWQLSC